MNAIDVLREWHQHDYGEWMLTAEGVRRSNELAVAIAAFEQLQQAAESVYRGFTCAQDPMDCDERLECLDAALRAVRAYDNSRSQRPSAGREGE